MKPTRIADATESDDAGKVAARFRFCRRWLCRAARRTGERTGSQGYDGPSREEIRRRTRGRHTAVEKADSNGHTVYRVRVVGLASDDANVLCSRLKAGGGACFVARN